MMLEKGSRLIMAGDSVTDCQRMREQAPCSWGSWGEGYVHVVYSRLLSEYPDKSIMVVNQGVSGDTSRDLLKRWDKDVMSLKPDYVSIMIGINDVWRYFDSVVRQESLVSKDEFRSNLREIVSKTKSSVKKIYFLTPVMFEINKTEPMFIMKKELFQILLNII